MVQTLEEASQRYATTAHSSYTKYSDNAVYSRTIFPAPVCSAKDSKRKKSRFFAESFFSLQTKSLSSFGFKTRKAFVEAIKNMLAAGQIPRIGDDYLHGQQTFYKSCADTQSQIHKTRIRDNTVARAPVETTKWKWKC